MIVFALGGLFVVVFLSRLFLLEELRAEQTRYSLKEALERVVSLESTAQTSELHGQLVHVSGIARARQPELCDAAFGVIASSAFRLARQVEMYQWKEKRTRSPGESRYLTSYEKVWETSRYCSEDFKFGSGHENPTPAWNSEVFSSEVGVGELSLSPELVGQLQDWKPLALESFQAPAGFERLGRYFVRGDLAQPEIGDLRVYFERVDSPAPVSVVGRMTDSGTLEPWTAPAGDLIGKVVAGQHRAAQMMAEMQHSRQHSKQQDRGILFLGIWLGTLFALIPNPELLLRIPAAAWLYRGLGSVMGTAVVTLAVAALLVLALVGLGRLMARRVPTS